MQIAQNNKVNQSQNVSRETMESIIIADIERLSKRIDLHYMFALEVTSRDGISTYFASNDKNFWLLKDLGLTYQEVIIVSEYPIFDENGRHLKSYKNILNMAQARYGLETTFSLCERLHCSKYVRQFYVDDIYLNIVIHR